MNKDIIDNMQVDSGMVIQNLTEKIGELSRENAFLRAQVATLLQQKQNDDKK